MKKIIAIAIALTVSVLLVGPGVAQGATVEELQAQIATLTASLAALQAQLTALGGGTGTVPTACAGITSFTVNMSQGSTGANVKCLQALLNTSADTQVAASGVGSLGNESLYFGSLTKAAVAKYQVKNSISPTAGYFGPITRAKINPMLVGGVIPPATCGNGTCGTGETNANCPADCPTTGGGLEGGILGTINSVPATGVEVYVGTTGVAVAAIDVKAIGDVVVNRLDLAFNKRPWLYISGITITDGTTSKTVSVTAANTSEVTVGSSYLFRIDGLSISIPNGTTKTLTVKIDAVSGLPGTETSTAVTLSFAANAVRATDGAGILQYAPTAALSSRIFTMKTAVATVIEVTANADAPKDRPVLISSAAVTPDIVLLSANVKAKNNAAILRSVTVGASAAAASGTTVVYLYDGDTLLSSTSTESVATVVFDGLTLTIPKDATKTLTVKLTALKLANYGEGEAASTSLAIADVSVEDASTFATVVGTEGSAVLSGAAYMYTKAPSLTLATTPTIVTTGDTSASTSIAAIGKIRINVTAGGGDIYLPVYDADGTASNGIDATSSPSVGITPSTTLTQTFTSSADNGTSATDPWLVKSGTTKWFEVTGLFDMCTVLGQTHFDQLKMNYVRWGTTAATAISSPNTWTWGLTDFKTGQINLNICQ